MIRRHRSLPNAPAILRPQDPVSPGPAEAEIELFSNLRSPDHRVVAGFEGLLRVQALPHERGPLDLPEDVPLGTWAIRRGRIAPAEGAAPPAASRNSSSKRLCATSHNKRAACTCRHGTTNWRGTREKSSFPPVAAWRLAAMSWHPGPRQLPSLKHSHG